MNNDRLKFRLWDIKNDEYVEDQCDECCISFDGRLHAGAYCDDGYTGHWVEYEQHEVIIEQCTGLKDKNGNLIYENDVLSDGQKVGYVYWDNSGWACTSFLSKKLSELEIIGNIHEQKDKQ